MSKTWSEMKEAVEAQMSHDPQRGTLATRAWQGVEEGLRHLAGVGYNFEIAPKGTMAAQQNTSGLGAPTGLSIGDSQKILAAPKDPVNKQFEAMTHN